jgi:SAM-dependent methyltransferase
VTCPICGSGAVRNKAHKDGVDILRCGSCQVAFWRPDAGFRAEALYGASYFESGDATAESAGSAGYDDYPMLEEGLRQTFRQRLARIPRPGAGARLLDIGAAFGFAVNEATRLGWRALGAEVSLPAARRAAERATGEVIVANALDLPFAASVFDVVTMWDVVEHLRDPHRAVTEVARVLRAGGRLVLSTGDVDSLVAKISGTRWHLYTLPEHLFFFSRPALRVLLEQHGLRVVRMRAHGARYPIGYLVERLRKTLLGKPQRRGPSPRWPGARLSVPVNLFDIVTVTAIRN